MKHVTIHSLVSGVRDKIDQLNQILDVLLSGYRSASEIIDPSCDHRQKYIDQLNEMHDTLVRFVEQHPALHADRSWQNAIQQITSIADSGKRISSVSVKEE